MTHDGAAFGRGLHDEQDFVAIVAIVAIDVIDVIDVIVAIVGHM
jgi:hypothetical protein